MLKTPHHLRFHFYSHSIHSPHQVSLLVLPLMYDLRLLTFHLFQLYCPIPTPLSIWSHAKTYVVSLFPIAHPESLFCTNLPKSSLHLH